MITTREAVRGYGLAGTALVLALCLVGCNGVMHPEEFPHTGPSHSATSNPQLITADDFGHSWVLDVDHGSLSCEESSTGEPTLRFTAPDGTVYAINSVDENADLPPIEDIADGSIGALRTFAFTVCDA